jgi:CelD/BcsL family acetyltransferase involved in cellulose biosynthesis
MAGEASIFEEARHRAFYERLTTRAAQSGWLRFSRIDWNGRPIAFHYGFCYRGRYLYGLPTFDVQLARHWPGEVMMRQLLLAAIAERADVFDFGIGGESYKYRYATGADHFRTIGLYPTGSLCPASVGEP